MTAIQPYAFEVSSNIIIDASCLRGLGAYANGSMGSTKPNARISAHPASRTARLISTRRIKAGDEILVSYGQPWWGFEGPRLG